MPIKVGINGYGRIGRNILRALYEANRQKDLQIVALNDLGDAQTNAYLTRHDSVHGKFHGEVQVDGDSLVVNGDRIKVLAERDPALAASNRPTCTAEEVEVYAWPQGQDGHPLKEVPIDLHNHGCDCMRYAVAYLDLGPRPGASAVAGRRPGPPASPMPWGARRR